LKNYKQTLAFHAMKDNFLLEEVMTEVLM